jgi:hypothetical protein
LAALDLRLKILVWDDDGQTRVSYAAPSSLPGTSSPMADRHSHPGTTSNARAVRARM